MSRRSSLLPLVPALTLGTLAVLAVPAGAQTPDTPIGPFVVDVRGAVAPYSRHAILADGIGVTPSDMPGLGLGFDVGGHWYFFRWKAITFGAGGNLHMSSGTQQIQENVEEDILEGPRVQTQLRTFVPQVSFNFGTGRGWSYLSGGMSNNRLRLTKDGVEQPTVSIQTINYGGGARWFAKPHLAFSLDLRFYAMNPVIEEPGVVPQPRMTQMVFSVGVSIK